MFVKKLSIVIPAYNEEKTVRAVVTRVLAADIGKISKEVIVVNDGSTDGTAREVRKIADKRVRLIDKRVNEGKGAAIRDGMKKISGEVMVIQDADLEYNPEEYMKLLGPILDGKADVVYGSRFMGGEPHRVLYFWHMVGNTIQTFISDALTNMNLTDMETCYKMMTAEVAKKITLEEKRFGMEPEITAKIAKLGVRVYEVGISYSGRSYAEGKKIGWRDGMRALWVMVKYNLISNRSD